MGGRGVFRADQQHEGGTGEGSGAQAAHVQDDGGQGELCVQNNSRTQLHLRGEARRHAGSVCLSICLIDFIARENVALWIKRDYFLSPFVS